MEMTDLQKLNSKVAQAKLEVFEAKEVYNCMQAKLHNTILELLQFSGLCIQENIELKDLNKEDEKLKDTIQENIELKDNTLKSKKGK